MLIATSSGVSVWDILIGGFVVIYKLFATWISAIYSAELSISIGVLIIIFLITAAYLSSGFLAGSIAESRGRGPIFHMILGFIIPFLYPAGIALLLKQDFGSAPKETPKAETPKLKTKGGGIQFKEVPPTIETEQASREESPAVKVKADKKSSAKSEENKAPAEAIVSRKELNSNAILGMEYLTEIALKTDGTAEGPFILELTDGQELEVLRILNPMENLSVLEMIPPKPGEQPRSVRIPYAKMKSIRYKD